MGCQTRSRRRRAEGCVHWFGFHEQLRITEWLSDPIFSQVYVFSGTVAPEGRNWTSLALPPPSGLATAWVSTRPVLQGSGLAPSPARGPALALTLASPDGQMGPSKSQRGLFQRESPVFGPLSGPRDWDWVGLTLWGPSDDFVKMKMLSGGRTTRQTPSGTGTPGA